MRHINWCLYQYNETIRTSLKVMIWSKFALNLAGLSSTDFLQYMEIAIISDSYWISQSMIKIFTALSDEHHILVSTWIEIQPLQFCLHLICRASLFYAIAFSLISFSLSIPEHWTLTTFFGASIISSLVAGFLPSRFAFSFTQNLPKPEIRTSSSDSRDCLISSSNILTVSKDFFWVKPFCSITASI